MRKSESDLCHHPLQKTCLDSCALQPMQDCNHCPLYDPVADRKNQLVQNHLQVKQPQEKLSVAIESSIMLECNLPLFIFDVQVICRFLPPMSHEQRVCFLGVHLVHIQSLLCTRMQGTAILHPPEVLQIKPLQMSNKCNEDLAI